MFRITTLVICILILLGLGTSMAQGPAARVAAANAAPTAFSFQGRLNGPQGPVDGACDFQFSLFAAETGGARIGDQLSLGGVPVAGGLFTIQLDFGAQAFSDAPRWVEVTVRCPGDQAAVTLSPRQAITAAPYALTSVSTTALQGRPISAAAPTSGQTLVWDGSQWAAGPAASGGFAPFGRPQTLDLADLGQGLGGYIGGFTDGRYAYLVPSRNTKLTRVNLENFGPRGVTFLDLTTLGPSATGFAGGFTDGIYGYLVPYQNKTLLRVDLENFTLGGVTSVDVGLSGFLGGFTDGRYGYLIPGMGGQVARVDLQNFGANPPTILDVAAGSVGVQLLGGFTDGHYGYFVPAQGGKLARVDLQQFTQASVSTLDVTSANKAARDFAGGFTDGRYAYLVPGFLGTTVRVDLQNFVPSGITALDLSAAAPGLSGFRGGFIAGHYGYFVPAFGKKLARVDLQNFTLSGVTAFDLGAFDASLTNFYGGFTDGRYGYLTPWLAHDKLTRISLFFGGGL